MRNYLVVLVAVLFFWFRYSGIRDIKPVSYSVNFPEKLEGPLAVNSKLDAATKLHEGKIQWPEAFATYKGKMYTGLGDGRIVEFTDSTVKDVFRTGEKCEGLHEEHICGRPLGMTFSTNGLMYVVDAYYGLFSYDIASGKKKNLLSSNDTVGEAHLMFLNDLTFDEDEKNLYLTQSSTRHSLGNFMTTILEHEASGRLLKYNLKTGKVSVVLKDVAFPNGVISSHDKSSILVAELLKSKVFRYHIKGLKEGQKEYLPMVLPGEPDNISRSKRGHYWVALSGARTTATPNVLDRLADKPWARKLILAFERFTLGNIGKVLMQIPHKRIQEIGGDLHTGRLMTDYIPMHGIIVQFNEKGEITQTLQSPSGEFSRFSEVLEHKGQLYLGSWRNNFIGKILL